MNEGKNICTVCGKLNPHPLWQFKPISEIAFTKIETPFFDRLQAAERAKYCPGHPEPTPRHDGNLDKDYQVEYGSEWDIRGVRIHATDPSIQGQEVFLVPHRALSLLDWLRQEEAELQRLEKEQGF